MSVLDQVSTVGVELTQKDISDIAVLRGQRNVSAQGAGSESSEEFLRRVMLAGIDKIREELAAETYASLAAAPDYQEYHAQRRAGRAARR